MRRYTKAIAADPNHGQAHLLRGAANRLLDRPEEAEQDFSNALERDPRVRASALQARGGLRLLLGDRGCRP